MQRLYTGCLLCLYRFVRSIVPPSTLLRHLRDTAEASRVALHRSFTTENLPRLHWVDNFAKCYASRSMFHTRDLLKQCMRTAHGIKPIPIPFNAAWKRDAAGDSIPALPGIAE